MKKNKILYVGNNLTKKTNYATSMDVLSNLLTSEGFTIYKSSSKSNKILRLLEMCFAVFYYRTKVNYVLIDTYSTSNFYYALITSQLCRLFRLKYLPILHGGNLPNRLEKNPIFSSLIFNNSFQNIAPSGYLKYEFEIKGYATQLVPNVISIANYKFKKRIKLKPKLLYVRAFANVYNPCMSIEVFKEIKKKYQKAVLCMVGPDKDGTLNDVKQLIDRYELHDSVEITGVLSKSEWHKKSEEFDVFINTTNVDNTPVSVIEAMALGFPIVSTNVGGMPFLVENNKDGVLVEKNNAIEMTIRIIEILEKNNISLAKNARIKAESFDCNIVKNKWFEILK